MIQIFDISMPVHEAMPVYKNKPEKRPAFEVTSNFDTGSCRETKVHLDVHTGTHVDAPLHMLPDGETIETVGLEKLMRPCRVLDLSHVTGAIHREDLEAFQINQNDFLLFKTRNSFDDAFNPEFIYLAEDGADYLVQQGIAGVGIDALGVERNQPGHPTHKLLFSHGAVIIEGLRLADIEPGEYFMVASPLKLLGIDAAPARVVLCKGISLDSSSALG